jgi:hypothetical protein
LVVAAGAECAPCGSVAAVGAERATRLVAGFGAERAHRGLAVPAGAECAPCAPWVVASAERSLYGPGVVAGAGGVSRAPGGVSVPAAGLAEDPVVVDRLEPVVWAHVAADPGGVGPRAGPSRLPPRVGGDPGRVNPVARSAQVPFLPTLARNLTTFSHPKVF